MFITLFLNLLVLFSPCVGTSSSCIKTCQGIPDGDYHSCDGCNVYASCGGGALFDGRLCPGNLVWNDNTKQCSTSSSTCHFWQDWGAWGSCSVTCGGGTRGRSRTCVGGSPGGAGCHGSATDTQTCNPQACSAWTAWGSWGSCSVTCGGGTQSRSRTCTGGSPGDGGCNGPTSESKGCGPSPCDPCVLSCQGKADGNYQSCGGCDIYVTCSGGRIYDNRPCPTSTVWDDIQKGCRSRSATCPNCAVTEWNEWSDCKHSETRPPAAGDSSSAARPSHARHSARSGEKMRELMMRKEAAWDGHRACVREGRCSQQGTGTAHACTNGAAGKFPCRNIDLVAHLTLRDLGYNPDRFGFGWDTRPQLNDIWGWTDTQTNDEYAIVGLTGATSFVRVSDPSNPEVVGILYNPRGQSGVVAVSWWRDMKTVSDHVYMVSEAFGMGLQVFDLRTLRGLGAANPVRELLATTWHRDLTGGEEVNNTHNVVSNADTQRIYLVGGRRDGNCLGGLKVYDVSRPTSPTFLGCYEADGYVHDAQCVVYRGPDTRYTNREICFCYNEDTLTIVDMTNPENGIELSRTSYTSSNRIYTHQGWITEDMALLLLDDELDEYFQRNGETYSGETATYIFDIRDLKNPQLKNTFYSAETSIDHNQYILGNYTYQTNYQAGLRILRVDQTDFDLNEVAFFDVYPDGTSPDFNGAWSNYPYFSQGARGTVAVSSVEFGLFILRPNMIQIERDLAANQKVGLQRRTRSIMHSNNGHNCPALEQVRQC